MDICNYIMNKKPYFAYGGKPKKSKKKPWLSKSTKSIFNPMRYISPKSKSIKRSLRAQQHSESFVSKKLYSYQRLHDKIEDYKTKKGEISELKKVKGNAEDIKQAKHELAEIKSQIKKLSRGTITSNISKKGIQIAQKLKKYEDKAKYYTDTTDKLKYDTVNYIRNRTDYINNIRPELRDKLGALSTVNHTKIAIIKLPNAPAIPVNKIKYSDFNVNNQKLTKAYLDQFKTVNDSITKINKDLNINNLSPNKKVELARELHRITKDGIYNPAEQERHFLKAVIDISYKDKYYKSLGTKSESIAKQYLERSGFSNIPEDKPEPSLKQRRDALQKKLLSLEQAQNKTNFAKNKHEQATINHLKNEIQYLDEQMKYTPDDIERQLQTQKKLLGTVPRDNPLHNEILSHVSRLQAHKADLELTKKELDTEETKNITKQITDLKDELHTFVVNSKLNINTNINELNAELGMLDRELDDKLSSSELTEKQRATIKKNIMRQQRQIQKQIINLETYQNKRNSITELENLLPDKLDTLTKELDNKPIRELDIMLDKTKDKIRLYEISNPKLADLLVKKMDIIQDKINKANMRNDPSLTAKQKEYLMGHIRIGMHPDFIDTLKRQLLADKDLNLLLAKQAQTDKLNRALLANNTHDKHISKIEKQKMLINNSVLTGKLSNKTAKKIISQGSDNNEVVKLLQTIQKSKALTEFEKLSQQDKKSLPTVLKYINTLPITMRQNMLNDFIYKYKIKVARLNNNNPNKKNANAILNRFKQELLKVEKKIIGPNTKKNKKYALYNNIYMDEKNYDPTTIRMDTGYNNFQQVTNNLAMSRVKYFEGTNNIGESSANDPIYEEIMPIAKGQLKQVNVGNMGSTNTKYNTLGNTLNNYSSLANHKIYEKQPQSRKPITNAEYNTRSTTLNNYSSLDNHKIYGNQPQSGNPITNAEYNTLDTTLNNYSSHDNHKVYEKPRQRGKPINKIHINEEKQYLKILPSNDNPSITPKDINAGYVNVDPDSNNVNAT